MEPTTLSLRSVWSGRGWPASVTEEASFRKSLGDPSYEFDRDDVTFVLTALAEGVTLSHMLEVAPGVKPGRLAAAYDHLEASREESVSALISLIELAADEGIDPALAQRASSISPVLVGRLMHAVVSDTVESAQLSLMRSMVSSREASAALEQALEADLADGDRKREIAQKMTHPAYECLWANPEYLPTRVTDIAPGRARALLGEEVYNESFAYEAV